MPATRRNDQPHIPDYEWPEDADMTECGSCISLMVRITELESQIEQLRQKNKDLNRRCQQAESIIAKSGIVEDRPQGRKGRSFGRALANYAAEQYRREAEQEKENGLYYRRLIAKCVHEFQRLEFVGIAYARVININDELLTECIAIANGCPEEGD